MTARDDIVALGQRISQSIIGQEAMVERLLARETESLRPAALPPLNP